jgi:hypothetical protein
MILRTWAARGQLSRVFLSMNGNKIQSDNDVPEGLIADHGV